MSIVVLYCWCHSDSESVLLYFTFVKGSILNRILRSCELSEGKRFVFTENPREGMCQG